jgi:putative acetyltransferase
MKITRGDLTDPRIIALLEVHVREARENSPEGLSFALDLSGLQTPDVTFFAMFDGEELMGIGALKELSARHGEIKSMRTHPSHLRKGVAATMLRYLVEEARRRGHTRVSLETGPPDSAYGPAIALYRSHGFEEGPAFGDYPATPFNRFYHLDL